ncbi:BTB/POZ protein [Ochromonadaceae sp. CCMP2298]|nr:BTB/POZ protein [Ochromonadaceae sp. CCMP2298]|mmetsp:Transcript_18021/g.39234  ORF Transcript_18021/g.39234 Transcript_18021/m.39234 type:complete len:190 (+) Transcript_18021:112-681(+)
MQRYNHNCIVDLNVGGVRFTTQIKTLIRFPDAPFAKILSDLEPRRDDAVTANLHLFIDRDGTHFRHILNFLRSPESYKVELRGSDMRELRSECIYYGLDKMMFRGTEKRIPYYNDSLKHHDTGSITVLFDTDGMHTIRDSGEPIEFCASCRKGYFNIGAASCYILDLNYQSPPAAQPLARDPCPSCRPR